MGNGNPEMEFSYISEKGNPKKLLTFQEVTFRAPNINPTLKKFLTFREMELSRPKLKKVLIFQEGIYKAPKTNDKSALKKFLMTFL